MKFFLFNLFIISLLLSACTNNLRSVEKITPNFNQISFDVVQKNLLIEGEFPVYVNKLIQNWFDNKVKIDGLEGQMTLTVFDYQEKISIITDGKKVDTSLKFLINIKKPLLSKTKIIKGEVSSFGTLSGTFSLEEFDNVINNTQSELILRLSRDLKSKI